MTAVAIQAQAWCLAHAIPTVAWATGQLEYQLISLRIGGFRNLNGNLPFLRGQLLHNEGASRCTAVQL